MAKKKSYVSNDDNSEVSMENQEKRIKLDDFIKQNNFNNRLVSLLRKLYKTNLYTSSEWENLVKDLTTKKAF